MNDVRTIVRKWAKTKKDIKIAVGALVSAGISSTAAELLCAGDYGSEPKAIRKTLLEVLAIDGFPVSAEKAS